MAVPHTDTQLSQVAFDVHRKMHISSRSVPTNPLPSQLELPYTYSTAIMDNHGMIEHEKQSEIDKLHTQMEFLIKENQDLSFKLWKQEQETDRKQKELEVVVQDLANRLTQSRQLTEKATLSKLAATKDVRDFRKVMLWLMLGTCKRLWRTKKGLRTLSAMIRRTIQLMQASTSASEEIPGIILPQTDLDQWLVDDNLIRQSPILRTPSLLMTDHLCTGIELLNQACKNLNTMSNFYKRSANSTFERNQELTSEITTLNQKLNNAGGDLAKDNNKLRFEISILKDTVKKLCFGGPFSKIQRSITTLLQTNPLDWSAFDLAALMQVKIPATFCEHPFTSNYKTSSSKSRLSPGNFKKVPLDADDISGSRKSLQCKFSGTDQKFSSQQDRLSVSIDGASANRIRSRDCLTEYNELGPELESMHPRLDINEGWKLEENDPHVYQHQIASSFSNDSLTSLSPTTHRNGAKLLRPSSTTSNRRSTSARSREKKLNDLMLQREAKYVRMSSGASSAIDVSIHDKPSTRAARTLFKNYGFACGF